METQYEIRRSQRKRTGAVGIPKVKTGCQTCKIRRNKCDESLPSCIRCIEKGWRCDFLQTQSLSKPEPSKARTLTTPDSLYWGTDEMINIQHFQSILRRYFSFCFDIYLIEKSVFQTIYSEPCIMHAVLAIIAFHKRTTSGSSSLQFCIKEYNQAITELKRSLEASPQNQELAILSGILFVHIELFQGSEKAVQNLLSSILDILKGYVPKIPTLPDLNAYGNGLSELPPAPNFETLFHALSSLDVRKLPSLDLWCSGPTCIPSVPLYFSSIEEARQCLQLIKQMAHSTLLSLRGIPQKDPHLLLPTQLEAQLSPIQRLMASWRHRFNAFTKRKNQSILEKASNHILLIDYLVSEIQLYTHLSNSEMQYDSHLSDFQEIILSATAVMQADQIEPSSCRPCFLLDIGMVQPLYFVVQKCRDAKIRRIASKVLGQVRKERVKEVKIWVEVAKWIIEKEEEGWVNSNGSIAEERRFSSVEVEFRSTREGYKITAWRKMSQEWEVVSGFVTLEMELS